MLNFGRNNMYDEALEIYQYLPIRKEKIEDEYISHLWHVFFTLDDSSEIVQPFMIMPFHLLFMLAIQYKTLRLANELNNEYRTAFILRREHVKLFTPSSVFDLSQLNERALPDLLRLINADEALISRIKKLVDFRNDNLAHANGGIAVEFEGIIREYIDCLKLVQVLFERANEEVARGYEAEMTSDDDKNEFIETRLLTSYLCPADFFTGKLNEIFGKVGSYI